jgi:murein L,D-transpeptidase YcbB/YkuD
LLAAALARLEEQSAAGEPAPVPAGPQLRVGQRDPRVAALRARLRARGDYSGTAGADAWYFDAALDAALRRLQRRHLLVEDGVLGERTLAAVNRSAAELADQLRVTLERWRWLPADLGREYVWVNIARARLDLVTEGASSLSMRVVVGHRDRPTPSLAGRINLVVFNPSWSVPARIAIEDLLPRQQADATFLGSHGFQVRRANGQLVSPSGYDWASFGPQRLPVQLVQQPGAGNSLGRIKIAFDNDHDIYLHDTPVRGLFSLTTRSLSSGCVRLEDGASLATRLIAREMAWDAAATTATIAAERTRNVRLTQGMPVWLVYLTAWTEDGEVRYGRDIYGRDAAVLAALRRASSRPASNANLQP